jgi:hypothetical protein
MGKIEFPYDAPFTQFLLQAPSRSLPRPPPPAFLRRWKPAVSFIAAQKRRKPFCYVPCALNLKQVKNNKAYDFSYKNKT